MNALTFDARLRYASGFQLDARFTADGGVTALFGPSGAGKTTILSLIAGGLRPDEGLLRQGDRTLVDTKAGVFLPPERRSVGMVFQDQLLFPHMTVRKNLLFGKGRRGARAIDFNRVVEMLEVVELLDRFPASLSGGQKQRVALGRALLRGPELLLMDEPLTALDQELKGSLLTYLERAVAEWRVPTLLVSHDRADVRRLASRVILIAAGRVVAEGAAANILDGLVACDSL